ncbi:SDR family NAD(P)-dependent oxidoreductase [Bordetella genomosp. 12]|uniref:Dehydrogenase n=1 Tax=Bordetella genomosp. 12 TaxID=463035 RepID=A0A261V9T6_9BORD|nr:glucose 1-dehydrogenase [Bordetella genomosp. 12]OZI70879.1 dehydrogenase [Bordetella genomosp. 12]
MRLKGKKAIVTGAAQGIGLAIAQRYVEEGASVLMSDINADLLATQARRLGMPWQVTDVRKSGSVQELISKAVQSLGGLDIMVSNAGIVNPPASFLELEESVFDHVMETNLKSQFLCGQAAARAMVAAGTKGVIINMSSVNARLAIPTMTPYAVSKAGSTQLTNVMALSLAEHGIRVVAIGPGTILTDLAREVIMRDEATRRSVMSRTPMRRTGEPEEVAAIAVFLASSDASYITGQTIYADGGRLGLNYTVPVDDI